MSRSRLAVVAVACLVALTGAACGGNDEAADREQEEAAAEAREEAREKREAEQERQEAIAAAETCTDTFEPLLDELRELDSRLDIGLSYDEYGDKVADVKVAYDGVRFRDVRDDFACIGDVGIPAENALNQYVKAYTIWDECFGDFNCDMDSVEPEMQQHWSKATVLVSRADRSLSRLARKAQS